MIELLKKLEKQDSIDINKEIKNLDFDNNQILLISRYIVENNKALIREAFEIQNTDNNLEISEELLETIRYIKNKEYIEGIEDINLVQLLNRGIAKAIENIKEDYSLSELISETYLKVLEFYNDYFNTMYNKIVFEVFDVYITISQLQIQNKRGKEFFYNSMGLTLYAIIQKELLKENELKDIIKERGITEDYYNYLHGLYKDYDINVENDSFKDSSKEIKEEYDIWYNSFLFDYIDTSLFIDYLELNGIESKIKETDKEIQKLLARVSEFEY